MGFSPFSWITYVHSASIFIVSLLLNTSIELSENLLVGIGIWDPTSNIPVSTWRNAADVTNMLCIWRRSGILIQFCVQSFAFSPNQRFSKRGPEPRAASARRGNQDFVLVKVYYGWRLLKISFLWPKFRRGGYSTKTHWENREIASKLFEYIFYHSPKHAICKVRSHWTGFFVNGFICMYCTYPTVGGQFRQGG